MYNFKVKHIYHSGFSIETQNKFLLFDYYRGDLEKSNKDTLVFVSHSHKDHFNLDVLNIQGDNVDYIFSSDVKGEYDSNEVTYIEPYESIKIKDVEIKAFSSTDAGVSFLVKVEGVSIFFAGDLNWWYWESDDDAEKLRMEKAFKDEIEKISKYKVDIGFFPVDPRLEKGFSFGGQYFIEKIKPKIFFPMHFADKYEISKIFKESFETDHTKVIDINHKGQVFEI